MSVKMGALPKTGRIMVEKGRAAGAGGRKMAAFNALADGKKVGRIEMQKTSDTAQIKWITVDEKARRSGVATRLYEAAARFACDEWGMPLGSDYKGSRAEGAEGFWQKQLRKGRATLIGPEGSSSNRFMLSCPAPANLDGLPRSGRIPMPTVKRALKSLGRKVDACGITPAALRLGMEVEREHRDVTRGGVLKTAKIAAAHLCESSRYYTELKKLERKLKKRR